MTTSELIQEKKKNADSFTREQLSEIIESASKAFLKKQPFVTEQEIAEQSMDVFIDQLAKSNKDFISKAKRKIMEIVK